MFVGPTPEAIHEFRRQCVTEDISAMLSRHLGKAEVDQVTALVNQLFDQDWATRKITGRALVRAPRRSSRCTRGTSTSTETGDG